MQFFSPLLIKAVLYLLLICFLPQVVKDTVNIQIGDVNDNAPNFHGQPYTVRIPEVRNTTTVKVMAPGEINTNQSFAENVNTSLGETDFYTLKSLVPRKADVDFLTKVFIQYILNIFNHFSHLKHTLYCRDLLFKSSICDVHHLFDVSLLQHTGVK